MAVQLEYSCRVKYIKMLHADDARERAFLLSFLDFGGLLKQASVVAMSFSHVNSFVLLG